jgi:signal transduction histidine kinase
VTIALPRADAKACRATLAVAVSALAAAGAAYGGSAVARGDTRAQTGAIAVATIIAGFAFAASGSFALLRLPRRDFGLMFSLVGLLLLASSMAQANSALPFTIGLVVSLAPAAVLAHAVLRFPDDHLHSQHERLLIALAYVDVTVLQAAMLMFMGREHLSHCPCPNNLLFVEHDENLHTALMGTQRFLGVVLTAAVAGVVVVRWRQASKPMRRAITPVLSAGLLWSLLILLTLVSGSIVFGTAAQIALSVIPVAFLFGLFQARLARGSLSDLLVDLQQPLAPGHLRSALAEALRDPSLQLAYWLPARRAYVDAEGQSVAVPDGERGVTRIDRAGEPVAALLHDPVLAENRALLDGVASAAGMTLENERLQAELRAQLLELRASRARIVEAGDAARRRLERNLHDGAQQRLVALSVALSLVSERVRSRDAETAEHLDAARAELTDALAELRELARGLHPALLSRGLAAALTGLAERAPLPVDVQVRLAEELPENVAATAYYIAAEALTNVARYASAQQARIDAEGTSAMLELVIEDNGIGGAAPRPGSGLEGLRDRIDAMGGTLELHSEQGAGTRLVARLPFPG